MNKPLAIPTRAKTIIGSAAVIGLAVTTPTLAVFIAKVDELLVARVGPGGR